jgi:hypothetical protein
MTSIKTAALAATIFGAFAVTGCSKKDNYAADTTGAAMRSADTGRVSSTTAAAAGNTTRRAVASKPAAKKTAAKKTAAKTTATNKTTTKKKAPTKPTYPAAVHR